MSGFRPRALTFLTLLTALGSACSTTSPTTGRTVAEPSAHPSAPADVCTALVSYWAREALTGGKYAGLDWEQKGLSNEQLVIHDDVLAAGRVEERRRGRPAALRLIDDQARKRCASANGATGSSENWRPNS
ncbi:hypothetical protein [Streptomyces sp. NPDC059175]|uniref:hypothetical protein n=1 Tax=unclassified Streptomyces TaxID=2593676 RepID=UPI0036B7A23F